MIIESTPNSQKKKYQEDTKSPGSTKINLVKPGVFVSSWQKKV